MKYIYLITFIVVLSVLNLSGCDNAEYKVKENSVYLADAASLTKSSIVTMEHGVDINAVVRLAQKTSEDIEVEVTFNPELVSQYNAVNGTEYKSLPEDKLPPIQTVTIPAGEISVNYQFHIDDFETKGDTYVVPLQLGAVVKGNVHRSNEQGQYIYILSKPLIVSVPKMSGASGKKISTLPEEKWNINVDAWTLEAWVSIKAYSKNNQAIFNMGSSDHEIYIRFGDANRPYNYLQVKTLGGQVETEKDLIPDTWYHWAFVYDGTTFTIYRNGERDKRFNPPAPKGGQVRFDFVEMITSSLRDMCMMSQVRLWKVVRSETEIQNNMYFEINPGNPNLIACWPMDEGEGYVFKDVTGNGHNAIVPEEILKGWEPNITFK